MPLIKYVCERCGNSIQKVVATKDLKNCKNMLPCGECGEYLERQLGGGSTKSTITMDNGVQARAVEILPDILELNQERSESEE